MDSKLPEISSDDLTARPTPPSYGMKANNSRTYAAAISGSTNAVLSDGEEPDELTPQAPKEADLPLPACLTDGSNSQIPRDYIKSWKVNDGNVAQRLKELQYTVNLLVAKDIGELVRNPRAYERDF